MSTTLNTSLALTAATKAAKDVERKVSPGATTCWNICVTITMSSFRGKLLEGQEGATDAITNASIRATSPLCYYLLLFRTEIRQKPVA